MTKATYKLPEGPGIDGLNGAMETDRKVEKTDAKADKYAEFEWTLEIIESKK